MVGQAEAMKQARAGQAGAVEKELAARRELERVQGEATVRVGEVEARNAGLEARVKRLQEEVGEAREQVKRGKGVWIKLLEE